MILTTKDWQRLYFNGGQKSVIWGKWPTITFMTNIAKITTTGKLLLDLLYWYPRGWGCIIKKTSKHFNFSFCINLAYT